ncbi:hypothetical protein [Nocardia pneumoniae]|uniref:hypothetical protein n=1 Tax=Nocardia pneumoniae TaxID=228601 RepID=UPI00030A85F9|nr:hypothetical protein [Nocardia pneumoniae]
MTSSTSRRRWGCLLPLATVILLVVGFAGYLALQARSERSHPAAAAPADLCEAIGPAVFERSVPDGVPQRESNYSSGSDAACVYSTADSRPPTSGMYGFLRVRLLRYGQVGWDSGAERAAAALADSCAATAVAGQFQSASGLGNEACTAYSETDQDGTAHGSAVIRRGADLIWVDYYRHPGTADQARQAVTEVALASLAATAQ